MPNLAGKENILEVHFKYKGQFFHAEVNLREDVMRREDTDELKDHLKEGAALLVSQAMKTVKGALSYQDFCIAIKCQRANGKFLEGSVIIGPPRMQGAQAPLQIVTGKRVFYRVCSSYSEFLDPKTQTLFCDSKAWEAALRNGASYLLVYDENTEKLYMAHKEVMSVFGVGDGELKARAAMKLVMVLEQIGPYTFEVPKKAHQTIIA